MEQLGQEDADRELQEALVIETAAAGHVGCLEAALSFDADETAWDRDRSRRYAPGQRP